MTALHHTSRRSARKGGRQGTATAVVRILGGPTVLRRRLRSKADAHEAIIHGIPGAGLRYMLEHSELLNWRDMCGAMLMNVRTAQRLAERPKELLSADWSGRTWQFAEILARATEVFGTRAEAEKWLLSPALALDGRRPLDLLTSPPGVKMVEQLLGRLEYGVFT